MKESLEARNSSKVYAFRQRNREKGTNNGNMFIVKECNVLYEYTNLKNEDIQIDSLANLRIDITGFNNETIVITGDEFDPEKVHTSFNPKYGTYVYDEKENTLIIEDKASGNNLIKGRYKVTLSID